MKQLFIVLAFLSCREPDPAEPLPFLREEVKQTPAHPGDVWFSDEPCGDEVETTSVNTSVNLFVCAAWDGFGRHETHAASIYFYSPRGELWTYGAVAAPVGSMLIPIAGTPIADRQLVGTWTVMAFLDDGFSSALGSIELTP